MNYLAVEWNPSLGIELGSFTIRYYSLMFVIAFSLGFQIVKRIFKSEGLGEDLLDKLLMYIVIATILGARLGHVFFYDWTYFSQHPEEILLPFKFRPHFMFTGFSGLASHGAAVGIVFSLYLFNKKYLKKSLLFLLDRIALTVALGGFFVRIGNLMNSEIIGKPTNTDFGFIFVQLGEDFPRYPTQLFEAFGYLLVFFLLFYLFWKTNVKEKLGFVFGLFFTLLWSIRFLIEFLKEAQDGEDPTAFLNKGQWLSIPLILIGVYFVFQSKKSVAKAYTEQNKI